MFRSGKEHGMITGGMEPWEVLEGALPSTVHFSRRLPIFYNCSTAERSTTEFWIT
jgi:hypothetical protein